MGEENLKNKKILGTSFIIIIIILTGLSIAMIASVSFPRGQKEYNNNYYFLIRQLFWLLVGVIVFFITSRFKYEKYKNMSALMYIAGVALLVSVLVFGKEVNGAKRWLSIGVSSSSISIQPSEFAKLILILVLAGVMERYRKIRNSKTKMLINMLILISLYAGLILAERSFSTTVQVGMIGLIMLFVSGVNLGQFFAVFSLIMTIGAVSIISTPYRLQRILGHNMGTDGVYQAKQSLIAIGSGGLIGKFYGNGLQKYFYLPEIHTDYIFSGNAEETGFLGSLFLIILYIGLLSIIVITLLKIKDMYARYILVGIFGMFSIQILGNLAVVLGLIPSTGIPLPIMSYGGSTTVVSLGAMGIVYNIIKALYIQEITEAENELF